MAALVFCLGMAQPARADVAAVAGDLERLRVELAALERIQGTQGSDPNQLARFEVRLGQLEEELRQLTGRVESLEFQQRALEQRIDELVADLDQRLAAIEQQGDEAGVAEPPPPAGGDARQARPATAPAEPGSEQGEGASSPAPGEEGLGTIPESALQGLPRPDAEAAVPPRRTRLPPEEQYDAAMDQLRAGDYASAERGLELFLEVNPDHPLAANAAYWLGESHYVRRNYAAAAAAFARNYRSYGKDSAKAVDNLLKLGMSLEGLGENEKACLAFEELTQEFPDAPTHIQQALARERGKAECA